MAQTISIFSWPVESYYFEQPWTINDVTYLVTARWNSRSSLYYIDIADSVSSPIVQGIPLKVGRNLIAAYASYSLPSGKMLVFDTTGQEQDPGQDDMGVTHSLYFVTAG